MVGESVTFLLANLAWICTIWPKIEIKVIKWVVGIFYGRNGDAQKYDKKTNELWLKIDEERH